MPKYIERAEVDERLTPRTIRRILEDYGFDFQRATPTDNGWNKVLGPSALGEGGTPNFSVNHEGYVMDWGSSGFRGSIYDVVMDIDRVDFPEAVRTVARAVGLSVSGDTDPNRPSPSPPVPAASPARRDAPSGDGHTASEIDLSRIQRWHTCLVEDPEEGTAYARALHYLTEVRGLSRSVLKMAQVGLAHRDELPAAWQSPRFVEWWIVIPVPDRENGGIQQIKRLGFDPGRTDWARFSGSGDKVARLPKGGTPCLCNLVGDYITPGPVVVAEGEIDALHAASLHFPAVTGTGGAGTWKKAWSATIAQIEQAQAHGVVICYDGDDAGRRGAQKVARSLHAVGLDVRIATLPDERDVNDVLRDGGRLALEALIEAAEAYRPPDDASATSSPDVAEAGGSDDAGVAWQPFPLDALPDPAVQYVQAASKALPADPAMIALPLLSVLSGAVGSAARLRLKAGWSVRPCLWTALCAPSGSTKSAAYDYATRPLISRESEARQAHEDDMKRWKATPEDDRHEADRPERDRYRTGDATPEAIVKVLAANPRGITLARDELAAWIGSFDRYVNGAADLQFWIEIYEGRQLSNDRAGQGNTTVDRPSISVCGTIQPGTLKSKLSDVHFDTGFAQRMVLAMPPVQPKQWTEAGVTRDVRDAYRRLLGRLYSVPMDTVLSFSPEAKRQWINYFNEANRDGYALPDGPLRSVAMKGITHTARIALVLALCEATEQVSGDAMHRAIRIGEWLTRETLRVYDTLDLVSASLAPLDRFAARLPSGTFKTADARAVAESHEIPRSTMYKWLGELCEAGTIQKLKKGLYRK